MRMRSRIQRKTDNTRQCEHHQDLDKNANTKKHGIMITIPIQSHQRRHMNTPSTAAQTQKTRQLELLAAQAISDGLPVIFINPKSQIPPMSVYVLAA